MGFPDNIAALLHGCQMGPGLGPGVIRNNGGSAARLAERLRGCETIRGGKIGFTQSRKVRKGRKEKERLSLCVPLRLGAFARAVLIVLHVFRLPASQAAEPCLPAADMVISLIFV